MPDATLTTPEVRVRPRGALLRTASITSLLVTSPLFGALYWFTADDHDGSWAEVLAIHVVVLALCVLVGARQLTVFTEVRDGVLRGNGIFSPVEEVALDRIARVDLVNTYVGLTPGPVCQLLVRDAAGERLFRMRGNFWHDGDLTRVAAALPVAPITTTEPVDLRDFFRDYPGSAYWFENRPWIAGVGIALGVIAIAGVAAGAMLISGERFGI
ncbi:hypothetical protein [Pseudolysinimonas sp.]|uniref:hypothetical protein n=1 Tax=Pseudolysinimonas sp. TaxID=2680009 RepID=UPI003F7E12E9